MGKSWKIHGFRLRFSPKPIHWYMANLWYQEIPRPFLSEYEMFPQIGCWHKLLSDDLKAPWSLAGKCRSSFIARYGKIWKLYKTILHQLVTRHIFKLNPMVKNVDSVLFGDPQSSMVQPSHSIEIRKSSTPKTGPQRGPLDCPGCSKSVGRRVAARVVSQESTTRRGLRAKLQKIHQRSNRPSRSMTMNWFKWKSIGNTMVFNINSSGFFWDFPWNHPLKIKVPWIENDIGKTHSFSVEKGSTNAGFSTSMLHIYPIPRKLQDHHWWSPKRNRSNTHVSIGVLLYPGILSQILTFALRLWSKYWLLHFDYDPNIDFCNFFALL